MITQITEAVEVINPLETLVAQSGLEPTKAQYILSQFQDYFFIANEWGRRAQHLNVTSVDQVEDIQIAREGRLFLKQKRIAIEKARKEMKEQSLKEGKAIDGIANVLKGILEPIEDHLDRQEHFAEYAEARRVTELVEARRVELVGVGINPAVYNLALMTEVEFTGILDADRRRKAEQAEAIKKAEEDRVAREAEAKRVREENDRLRAEMAEKERVAREEREASEAQARKEREVIEARARAERELSQKRIEEERMERERLEAELRAKEDDARREREKVEADARAKAEADAAERRRVEEEERRAVLAPDREKLLAYAKALEGIEPPDVNTDRAREIVRMTQHSIRTEIDFLRQKAEEL